ncbi:DNA helicase [Frankia canadensis]|uniref:DNA helicase n=1 Tax=Frankia canadensis TaxID=1836972 RepID=A0A2I2KII8_9ACTN|nr:AAA domain-containing protein [Frankia canadensis]SNQ45476.1 DNA helicase [Frankia canadensis]SOU52766.1 DNA helicase [Frankia canadensis]
MSGPGEAHAPTADERAALADRCHRLVRFLHELAVARGTRVRRVEEHPLVVWLADLPTGIDPVEHAGPGEVLLTAPAAAALPPPPPPPPILADRLRLPDAAHADPGDPPTWQGGTGPDDERAEAAYRDWLPGWRIWAGRARADAERRALHNTLHALAARVAQEGDALELVLATGLLTWRPPGGPLIREHLLTTRVGCEIDPVSSDIRVRIPAGASTRLGDGPLLDAVPGFRPERTNTLHERLHNRPAAPLGPLDARLLRDWLTLALDIPSDGFTPQAAPPPPPDGDMPAQVSLAPALVLRVRGQAALLGYYERMLEALRGDGPPPLGLAQLVATLDTPRRLAWLAAEGATSGDVLGADPLLPLPTSPEQSRVLERLGADNGVVVEGPPGTGKTHTIANLICALLAEGQRVLVTSQKAQALRVLRAKLPPDLQRLCVSLTDTADPTEPAAETAAGTASGSAGPAGAPGAEVGSPELAASVNALAAERATYQPEALERRVERALRRREAALAAREALADQARTLRAAELAVHPDAEVGPGWGGTRAAVAARVRAGRPRHGWLPLPVPATPAAASPAGPAGPAGSAVGAAPLTDEQASELLVLLRRVPVGADGDAGVSLPDDGRPGAAGQWPVLAATRFAALLDIDAAARAAADIARAALDPPARGLLDALATAPAASVEPLRVAVTALARALDGLDAHAERLSERDWIPAALDDALAGRDRLPWAKVSAAAPLVAEAIRHVTDLGLHAVELPAAALAPGITGPASAVGADAGAVGGAAADSALLGAVAAIDPDADTAPHGYSAPDIANAVAAGTGWDTTARQGTAPDPTGDGDAQDPAAGAGLDPATLLARGEALAAHLDEGGEVRRRWRSRVQREADALLRHVTVDGLAPTTPDLLALALTRLRAQLAVDAAERAWTLIGRPPRPADPIEFRLSRLVEGQQVIEAIDAVVAARDQVTALAGQLAPGHPPAVASARQIRGLAATIAALAPVTAAAAADQALTDVAAEHDRLAAASHAPSRLADVAAATTARDRDAYAEAEAALSAQLTRQRDAARRDALLAQVRAAHPALADLLTTATTATAMTATEPRTGGDTPPGAEADEDPWPGRLGAFTAAWSWARAASWLARVADADQPSPTDLDAELDAAEDVVAATTAELAGARAWRHCLARMGAEQSAALRAYADAVAAGGTLGGRHTERYRQAAREAMEVAQSAVPAWVMPIGEVLSTIPPVRDSFDVVIVDEGSQAGLDSLFLLWLAPRVIVVGDDRQCTPPDDPAQDSGAVLDRLDALLPDVPSWLRVGFTPRSSLFGLLRTRFGEVVRLREHFRCMPEIIEWSSAMFYRDAPLVPLRQFGADRLPPLAARFVPHGATVATPAGPRNPAEADALVAQVLACAEDARYGGLTFGVVVAQGTAQATLIRDLLTERMSAAEHLRRRLRVGTPADFQGDERDVVFVSLVVAPADRPVPLTRLEYQRRFNVAASRARDQVWLFHSVGLTDLDHQDLRHSYLGYVLSSARSAVPPAGARAPSPAEVPLDRPHPAFGSLFEQRVFRRIAERGYLVAPRLEVNGQEIDLVVYGGRARFAVGCDGDAGTGPERIARDFDRERELRRAGWRFWRVRQSDFERDPDAALATLWPRLAAVGIAPLAPAVTPGAAGVPLVGAGACRRRRGARPLAADRPVRTGGPR